MPQVSDWVERRSSPVVAAMFLLVLIMAFSLFGHSALHVGHQKLASPSDLWSLASSSIAMLHGHFAHVYVKNGALSSPPALEVVLAPVLGLGQLVGLAPHLRTAGEPLSLWFVLGPAAALLASTVLFALDAVARHWGLAERPRLALALVGALGVADVAGGWGHPEDCVALAFVVWAALALERDGAAAPRAALLLGLGIAFQPLAVLGVAPVLARLGWRRVLGLSWRLALPSLAVIIAPLVTETHQTLFVLVHQPFQPALNSVTPLTHLAPVISRGLDGGGPTRLVATVLGVVLAIAVCRRRHDLPTVLTVTAVAFFIRIALETEMNWYYLWPVPALCLLLSLRRGRLRFALCTAALALSMVLGARTEHHLSLWWPALMATAVAMLLSVGPSPQRWVELARGRVAVPPPPSAVECDGMVPVGAGLRRE
jgi:hypothetical protein